jgi:hypothetical protein
MNKFDYVWEGEYRSNNNFIEQTKRIEKAMKYRGKPVSEATSEQLLFELINRNGVDAAPTKTVRNTPHVECLVGIGNNETAFITMVKEAKSELEDIALGRK